MSEKPAVEPPAPPSERSRSDPAAAAERAGELRIERLRKDDGRALIAYWRRPAEQ